MAPWCGQLEVVHADAQHIAMQTLLRSALGLSIVLTLRVDIQMLLSSLFLFLLLSL